MEETRMPSAYVTNLVVNSGNTICVGLEYCMFVHESECCKHQDLLPIFEVPWKINVSVCLPVVALYRPFPSWITMFSVIGGNIHTGCCAFLCKHDMILHTNCIWKSSDKWRHISNKPTTVILRIALSWSLTSVIEITPRFMNKTVHTIIVINKKNTKFIFTTAFLPSSTTNLLGTGRG